MFKLLKIVKTKEVNEWLNIMNSPQGRDPIQMFWRFCGALAILEHLNVIADEEVDNWIDDYIDKYLREEEIK